MNPRSLGCFVIGLSSAAHPAFAHVEAGVAAGFATGVLHPLSGWDHVLAMVAVGPLGRAAACCLPLALPGRSR